MATGGVLGVVPKQVPMSTRVYGPTRRPSSVLGDLVQSGLLKEDPGRIYDRLVHDRQQGDHIEFVSFDAEDVASPIGQSRQFVGAIAALAGRSAERRDAVELTFSDAGSIPAASTT